MVNMMRHSGREAVPAADRVKVIDIGSIQRTAIVLLTWSYCHPDKAQYPAQSAAQGEANKCSAGPLCASIDKASGAVAQKPSGDDEKGTEYFPEYCGIKLKITDALLALFTAPLVIIGGIQARRLRETIDSVVRGERPYLYVRKPRDHLHPTYAPGRFPFAKEGTLKSYVEYQIVNLGRTAAILESVRVELALGPNFAPKPKFINSKRRANERYLVPDPEAFTDLEQCECPTPLTREQLDLWTANKLSFLFFGNLIYRDNFGDTHTRWFAYRLVHTGATVWGGKRYNYETSKKTAGLSK